MQIDEECWEAVVAWLGKGDGKVHKGHGKSARYSLEMDAPAWLQEVDFVIQE